MLRNRRAGEGRLAWNLPGFAGPDSVRLRSSDFELEGVLSRAHAGRRAGGENLSPALSWTAAPGRTAQWLLVIQDVDSPTRLPFVHCVALLDADRVQLARGALGADTAPAGVRVLRSGMGRGYVGPMPIRGHGPHRYVFQIFALAEPLRAADGGVDLESARAKTVLAGVRGPVLGRGRLDGFYTR
ncbi:YbhB/YbcL family Raf kinase inhibitor-like protein [Speluncibacter jeojiensis]|uniref:YbhB/YbcL family Raf kinase inhibitor-like protein n=1 Tax=Speluncibacter jeojiensis TaxID=2710754 RepID=UPI00240F6C98|nr:YbhB/YbcL family Raf kinase inhibitor-like protein [Rhodococcus sp. D2-41]